MRRAGRRRKEGEAGEWGGVDVRCAKNPRTRRGRRRRGKDKCVHGVSSESNGWRLAWQMFVVLKTLEEEETEEESVSVCTWLCEK